MYQNSKKKKGNNFQSSAYKSEKQLFHIKLSSNQIPSVNYNPILSKLHERQNKKDNKKTLHNPSNPLIRYKHITLNDDSEKNAVLKWTINELHNFINNRSSINQNEKIVQYLLNLDPLSSQLHKVIANAKEELIRKIAIQYKAEIYEKGSLIFRYGSDADKFYIIHQGKIAVFFPYYENVMLSEEEYFSYLLRMRRFGENEMLNNVLLLNQNTFLFDDCNFDFWIKKAYNTLLKIKVDPTFINKDTIHSVKRMKHNSINNTNANLNVSLPNEGGSNKKEYNLSLQNYFNSEEVFFDENELFDTKHKKQLVLKVEKELIQTIQVSFPNLFKEIRRDPKNDNRYIILGKKLPSNIIPEKPVENPTIINSNLSIEEYISRIRPPCNTTDREAKRKKVIALKYFFIKYLQKGEHFGDIFTDSMTLFTQAQLNQLKQASNASNIQLHQYNSFRLITTIAVEDSYMGTIPRKCYMDYMKNISEKMNFKKLNFILNNQLFKNSTVPQLIKTYSLCFIERKLRQGDVLLRENEERDKDNMKIYFIEQGEFAVQCTKNFEQMDKLITQMGYGELINSTFPQRLRELIDTPYYERLVKNTFTMKLNYLQVNDIIGISEVMSDGKYAFTIACSSKTASIYEVNGHIIRLLIESDKIIHDNKDRILKNKNKIYSDCLLKQRKIKFDCLFEIERTKYKPDKEKKNNSCEKNEKKIILKQGGLIFTPSLKNYNNMSTRSIAKCNSSFDINNSIMMNRTNSTGNFTSIRNVASCRSIKTKFMIHNKSCESVECDNNFRKSFIQDNYKPKANDNSDSIGELDVFLANTSGKITMQDLRMKKSQLFREKMKKEQIERKERMRLKNLTNSDKTDKRKLLLSARLRNLMPNLKINKNLDEKNNLSIIYKNNIPSQVINPLAFDDFNRTYNTSSYYQKLFKQSSKQQFVLNLRIQDSKSQSQRKQNTKIRLNGRNHSYVNNNRNRGKKQFYINK